MWRVSIYILLFLMTPAVARAEEPNVAQRAIIHVDRIAREVKEEWESIRPLRAVEERIPLDDFRFYLRPRVGRSVKKGKFYYTVGFKFTF